MSTRGREIGLRPPGPGDAGAVLELLRAREAVDLGRVDVTLADVQDEWRELDPSRCVRVAMRGAALVGYAAVRPEASRIDVSPDAEADDALFATLLSFCEVRERAERRDEHRQWVAGGATGIQARLEDRGYRHARSYHEMCVALPAPVAAADGHGDDPAVAIAPLDPDRDAADLHRIDDAAFRDRADYIPETLEQFVAGHLRSADLDRGVSCIARDDGETVGFALAGRRTEVGSAHVRLLAVSPGRQGRGIGRHLLAAVFAAADQTGLAEVTLHVASDNPDARRFYERLGMRERSRQDVFERVIEDA